MRTLLLLMICLAGPAWAEGPAPVSGEEGPALQEQAKALHEQAAKMRSAAETALVADKAACWDKVLVGACQDEAAQTRIERIEAARRLEQEARAIERRLRWRDHTERDARRAAEAPRRAAEAAAQAERNRQEREQAMERVERRRAEAEQGVPH